MFLLVLAYPGSPGQKAVKRLCVWCVCVQWKGFLYHPVDNNTCYAVSILCVCDHDVSTTLASSVCVLETPC